MAALLMAEKEKDGRTSKKQFQVKCSERFQRAITQLATLKETSQAEECDAYLKDVEDELSDVMASRQAELGRPCPEKEPSPGPAQ